MELLRACLLHWWLWLDLRLLTDTGVIVSVERLELIQVGLLLNARGRGNQGLIEVKEGILYMRNCWLLLLSCGSLRGVQEEEIF